MGVTTLVIAGVPAWAASFNTGTDLEINWDNTVKLSTIYQPGSTSLNVAGYCTEVTSDSTATIRASDQHGCGYGASFISGRLDWTSELDLAYRGFGIHASSAAWYDVVDNSQNADKAFSVHDPYTGSTAALSTDTSELGGRNIELSEAFAHGTVTVSDDQPLTFRVGRHTLVWGESLYFANNGIAAGQLPIDTYVVQAVSTYQTKDVFLPVGQASFNWQVASNLAIEGYYQFEWRRSRINPEDASASATDILGAEGNRVIGLVIPGIGPIYYGRGRDQAPPSSTGQYGLALRWQHGDFDYGLYGLRYNAKTPNIDFYPGLSAGFSGQYPIAGTYSLQYPRGIEIYGVSATGSIGNASIGIEISGRRNMPLVNGGIVVPSALGWRTGNGLYPAGDTLHAQLSWVYVTPPLPGVPAGATWTGEIAANRLLQTTANPNQLQPGRTRTAAGLRTVFEPRFFQVLPRVDITTPIGVGYDFLGLSEVDSAMNRGTGDISVGITATLDQVWRASLGVTHYFGKSKNAFIVRSPSDGGQSLENWDFISVTVQRNF